MQMLNKIKIFNLNKMNKFKIIKKMWNLKNLF